MPIEKRGITQLFDVIVLSAEEGVKKPDPQIYKLLLDRLQTQPDETVFVDDNAENVAAAVALGVQAIQFHSTAQAIASLEAVLFRP
jgi:putative hydrolase of the HAD superfamily